VIGGPGAFVVTIKDRDKFKEAIRTKLVLEVAGRTPERRVIPVVEKEPRVSCMIGEKIWQDRWDGEIACPGRSAACSSCETVRCRAGAVANAGVWYGPGSAQRHEECRSRVRDTGFTSSAPISD